MNKPLYRAVILALGFLAVASVIAFATRAQNSAASNRPADADLAAIRQTALDYIEGWYEGNAERMERALHPELAKRIVRTDAKSGRSGLGQMSAMTLIQGTKNEIGRASCRERV